MLNGKFFAGLPPGMIERSGGKNRQQSNFFWPDESNSESVAEKNRNPIKRRQQTTQQNGKHAMSKELQIETKQLFDKEFSKSSIQFGDKNKTDCTGDDDVTDGRLKQRNKNQLKSYQQKNLESSDPSEAAIANRKAYNSKIQFYDFPDEDLNNFAPRADKNVKANVERNAKNSPKLQNKTSLRPSNVNDRADLDHGIQIIENNVKSMNVGGTHVKRNKDLAKQNSPPPPLPRPNVDSYGRNLMPRRIPEPYYDNYSVHRYPRPPFLERNRRTEERFPMRTNNRCNTPPLNYLDHETPTEPESFQSQSTTRSTTLYLNNTNCSSSSSTNNSKAETTSNNSSDTTIRRSPSPLSTAKHLRSNISFNDNCAEMTMKTPPSNQRRNIRSTAVNRVSVGLPN